MMKAQVTPQKLRSKSHCASPCSSPKSDAPTAMQWGIACLMLAATAGGLHDDIRMGQDIGIHSTNVDDASYHSAGSSPFGGNAPYLSYAASVMSELDMRRVSAVSVVAADEDDEETRRKRRSAIKAASVSPTAPIATDSDISSMPSDDDEGLMSLARSPNSDDAIHAAECDSAESSMMDVRAVSLQDLPAEALANALEYLTFDELEVARYSSDALEAAADLIAPKPLPTPYATFIRWEPEQLQLRATHRPNTFTWRCMGCASRTTGTRCNVCRSPIAQAACRVFVGQMRKAAAAQLTRDMIARLTPEVNVLHVEEHTQKEGKCRGCVWVYVDSPAEAWLLTSLHKRVFIDVDEDMREGYWYVTEPSCVPQLRAMAEVLGFAPHRPMVLPRQPLVAELPATSMMVVGAGAQVA